MTVKKRAVDGDGRWVVSAPGFRWEITHVPGGLAGYPVLMMRDRLPWLNHRIYEVNLFISRAQCTLISEYFVMYHHH